MTSLLKGFKPYIILFVVVILGYWQITFFQSSLKWDLIDVVFPLRFYFSECIQSGYFPFWNPYLQTGTPFFADLQAPTFYPELLYTSLLTGYSIYTMHILFVLYLFIAAAGMYRLSFFFNKNTPASLVAGVSYAFSGFIIGHGQHFFLLVGAAWIPFVLVHYLKLNKNRTFIDALKTAVFIFLMVSGAYQALSFTLLYLIILIFSYFLAVEIKEKSFNGVKELVKVNLYLFLLTAIFLLPLIVSTIEILASVDRLEQGINLEQSLGYGKNFKSLISFVLPFSTLKYDAFFAGVDVSMRNHYFGLITLLFFIAGLLKKRTNLEYLILGFGILIFASSFSFLPVRELLFRYVPFMNMFKYADYISVFGFLAFILLAANFMATFEQHWNTIKSRLVAISIILLIGLFSLIVYSSGKITSADFDTLFSQKNLTDLLKNLTFYQHVIIQSAIQVLVVLLFLLIIIFHKKIRYPLYFIVVLIFAEIVLASQLNIGFTVADSNYKPSKMQKDLSLNPNGFPVPVNGKIIFNDQMHESFQPFWRNTYVFTKQISFNAFSSFELNSYSKLDDLYPNLKNAVLNNHLFYFSDKIFPLKQFNDSAIDIQNDTRHLYFSDEDYELLSGKKVMADSSASVKIVLFSPNKVIVETSSKTDLFLTMLQTNFKGWDVFVDNLPAPVYTSNFNYRTILLPVGTHVVRYEYANNKILVLYIVSNILFLLAVLFLLGLALRKINFARRAYLVIPLLLLLVLILFTFSRLTVNSNNLNSNEVLKERWSDKNPLFRVQRIFNEADSVQTESSGDSGEGFRIVSETEFFSMAEIPVKEKNFKSGTLVVTAKINPENYNGGLIVSDIFGENISENNWHASKIERQIEGLNRWNEIVYSRNLYNLDENDIIKVFIWNLNKANFEIDSITVNIFPLEN